MKTVLVTGASGWIGKTIAGQFAKAGYLVFLHYNNNAPSVFNLAAKLSNTGYACRVVQGDLSTEAGVDQVMSDIENLDVLINNAGIYPPIWLKDLTLDQWNGTLATNLTSAFLLTREVARRGRPASIINISSIEATMSAPEHAHYATSKAGLNMLTRVAALELGPLGIRVNSVSPGLIDAPGLSDAWPEGRNGYLQKVPLGRLGMPADVGAACLFLASDLASWITGAELVVDGGMLTNRIYP